ncbi:MAG: hypothetical protein ACLQA5_17220 [Solirubrobacteraceae bacterium]
MATVHAESVISIAVDRDMRRVLRTCLRSEAYQLEDFEGVIIGSDARAAHEALARAVHLVQMLDQLGWTDDDPPEHRVITVALDSFVPWLRGHRSDLVESLADEVTSHHDVLGCRRQLKVIEALLERLDAAAGLG